MAMYFPEPVADREAADVQQEAAREPNIGQHERLEEIEEIIDDQEAVVDQNVPAEPVSNEEPQVAEIVGYSNTEQADVHQDAAAEAHRSEPILGTTVARLRHDDQVQLPIQNTIALHGVINNIAPQELQIAEQQSDEVAVNVCNAFGRGNRVRKIPDRLIYKRFQCAQCFRFIERSDIPGENKLLFCSTRCFHQHNNPLFQQ